MPIKKVTVCLGLITCAAIAGAQAPTPTTYTITESGGVPGGQTIFYRSGSKALIANIVPAQGATPASKTYSLYDIAAGKNWAWNPDVKPIQCSAGTFQGDWGDPFAATSEVNTDIAKGVFKSGGPANINGMATVLYSGTQGGALERIWFDKKDDLVVRVDATLPGGGQPVILVNVTKVSFAPPPASLFVLPPSCAGVKAPPTPSELIADETGDNGANYEIGTTGPGSKNSCSVVLRVVEAKTFKPITHIQVAIDTQYNQDDPNPPHYVFGVRNDGTSTYAGGHVREITNAVHNGTVSLGTPPPYFMLDVNVIQPGHGADLGLVYRKCFAPAQVLLYVVKDYGKSTQSGDYLWVKSGKNAAPPTH
ncbi:MAG: hypothetical protein ACLQHF_11720 [Terracidiphilus sp.]